MVGEFFCKTIIIYRQTEIYYHAFFPNAPAPFGFSPCFLVFFGPGAAVGLWQCAGVITVEAAAAPAGDAGSPRAERPEEKLPLQELRSTADRSVLAEYETSRTHVQVWRIDSAALPRLQALRERAMGWKRTDDGSRQLGLGLELSGCQQGGSGSRVVTTLLRFNEAGEYIPLVRNLDLAETMPAHELAKRFPTCTTR